MTKISYISILEFLQSATFISSDDKKIIEEGARQLLISDTSKVDDNFEFEDIPKIFNDTNCLIKFFDWHNVETLNLLEQWRVNHGMCA